MNAADIRALADRFSSNLTAARLAKQGQNLTVLAENVEAALTTWSEVATIAAGFLELMIDWSGLQPEIEALKQSPYSAIQELILVPESELATKPASTFRGEQERNATRAKDLLRTRWASWCQQALAPLSALEPVLDRLPVLAPLKPKIPALKRAQPVAPPSTPEAINAARQWQTRCQQVVQEANSLVDPGFATFLSAAVTLDGTWLDLVSSKTLTWMIENGLASYVRLRLSDSPNPHPAAVSPAEAAADSPKDDDDDWT